MSARQQKDCRDHYFCVESVTVFVSASVGPIWSFHLSRVKMANNDEEEEEEEGEMEWRREKNRRKKGKEEEKEEDEDPVPDESVVTGHGEYDMASRPFRRLWQRLHA